MILYDPQGRVTLTDQRPAIGSATVREWGFLACSALADIGKYVRRRSAWEALGRLNAARDELWKLVAVSLAVPDPHFGVTSILDFAADRLPAAMDAAVADLSLDAITQAARAVAALLVESSQSLPPALATDFPGRMLGFVTADLAALSA